LATKSNLSLFTTYIFLSTALVIHASLSILQSLPTVQEVAYRNWLHKIEPLFWTNLENESQKPLPSIQITTPTDNYFCIIKKEVALPNSVNQEQILRYLQLIETSKSMRHKTMSNLGAAAQDRLVEVKIFEDTTTTPLFTGIVEEGIGGISLKLLLSLANQYCSKTPL